MIRIYLDWSVISSLKTDKYAPLLEFIRTHKEKFSFIYTPAHFNDLMKSYAPENSYFDLDLEQLEWLSGNHLLEWIEEDWELPGITPKSYFQQLLKNHNVTNIDLLQKLLIDAETEENSIWNFGKLLKSIFMEKPSGITINENNRTAMQTIFPFIKDDISQWDLIEAVIPFIQKMENERDFYKSFRKSIGDQGLKLEDNAGNWNPEDVFENIGLFFKSHQTDLTFKKYVEMTVGISKNGKPTIHDHFTTAYLLLDLIGFKPDRLPKPTDSLKNIRTDVEHAFYASRCDYFVTNDKNLAVKAKVLYKEFAVETQVLMSDQLISEISKKLHYPNEDKSFINDALQMVSQSTLLAKHLKKDDPDLDMDVFEYKLPVFYFDSFTKVDTMSNPEKRLLLLNFYRPYSTHYLFSFHTETERLVRYILEFFGHQNVTDVEENVQGFVYDRSDYHFKWEYKFGFVQLYRDPETREPSLLYVIKV
ncbi:hypothetical protein PYS58_06520 [Chryseobacterium indologenes]|uniref:hypothetical protein n=1 Tax=Chryseobacterium indologenes TaxID=253 RepID=UPI0023E8D5A5|nr:hypothetical protein [Chryseobacterium indologenes]WET50781.1 hypothetical protein PYS58_06520 [Chryseobacterium indologenes]